MNNARRGMTCPGVRKPASAGGTFLSCLSALLIGALPLPAMAGDWKLSDSVSADFTYVDRSGDNGYSGMVLQLSPSISLTGNGARATADISYRPTLSVGTSDTDPEFLTHSLLARGRVEAIEDFFYLGANASARQVGNTSLSAPVDSINSNTDGGQSYSLQLTPEFRHRLNRYADIVSQNSIDYVTYSGTDRDQGDSFSTRVHLGARSGRHFLPLSWSLDASQQQTEFDDRDDSSTAYVAGIGYRVSPKWGVNGSIGYEENDVETNRNETDGTTWNAGFIWTPNPRTTASANYGYRFIGNTYSGAFTHVTRRTRLGLDVSRELSNRRSAQLVDSFFFLVDDAGSIITDPNTGDPLAVNPPSLLSTDENFVSTQLRAIVSLTGRRTTVSLTGTIANRDYEVSPIDEDSYSVALNATRRLGNSISASVGAAWRTVDSSDGDDGDSYDLLGSLSRQIAPRTSVSINLLHRNQDGGTGTGLGTGVGGGDYTENRIGISLRTSFL